MYHLSNGKNRQSGSGVAGGVRIARNKDENKTQQDNIVPASAGEGGMKMAVEEKVCDVLAQYRNDEVMLDAFFQWANGQFRRIGEGKHAWAQEKAYGYFLSNLRLRYGLSAANAEDSGMKLEGECKALAENGDEFELKKALIAILSGTIGDTLRKNVQRKLGEASVSARGLLAVYNWLRGFPDHQYSMSSTAWTGPLEALYRVTLGTLPGSEVKSFSTARDELISCGVINKSFYESSSGKTSYEEYLSGILIPEIDLTSIVPPPDESHIRTYLQALFTQQAFEQARILEEVALCGVITYDVYGKGELPREVIPHRGLFAYVDTERGKVAAVNPLSREILLKNMLEWKMLRLKGPASTIETALDRLRDQAWPEADLTPLSDKPDRRAWRLDQIGAPRLFIFVGNWLSESDLVAIRNLGAEPLQDAFMFALTDQSLPSIEKVVANSLKMWDRASINVMTFKDAKWTIHTLKGTPHSKIQHILEQLSEFESGKPLKDGIIVAPPPPPQPSKQVPQPIPSVPPKPAPFPEKLPSPPTVPVSGLRVLLGMQGSEKVFWCPANERSWNFAIVGSAGTGKTQIVKSVLNEFARQDIPYIVFDFRNDYVPIKSLSSVFGSVLDLSNISINPLELDGSNSPRDQKYQVSDIIALVYTIGERQIGYVRDAIKLSYEDKGIHEDDEGSWTQVPPTFTDIQLNLEHLAEEEGRAEKESIKGIFARLDPIFDYGIFSTKTVMPFDDLVKSHTIVNLGMLPNDNLKAVVCEFLLRKLRYYLYGLPESREPRLFIVIDEAHRLKYEKSSSTGQLLKEARKYGVGLTLSTQDPVDFPEPVYNNIGGILSLQLTDPKYAKGIAEHLGGKVNWQSVKNELSEKFAAFVKFSSQSDVIKFKVIPHYQREQ